MKMVINFPMFDTLEKANRYTKSSVKPFLVPERSCHCVSTTRPSCADPKRNVWVGQSPTRFCSA